jgi:phosphoribosylamine-glycine ligase
VVGWCSDCVSKVANESDLALAVRKASDRYAHSVKPSMTVVVEPCFDGPEIDVNVATVQKEIIFFDVNDDFPNAADAGGARLGKTSRRRKIRCRQRYP